MKEIGMLTVMHSEHKGLVTVGGSERRRGGCRTSQACKGATVGPCWRAQASLFRDNICLRHKLMSLFLIFRRGLLGP